MKNNVVRVLTGLTAVSMAMTQPMSVLANEGTELTNMNEVSDEGGD